MIRAGFWAVVGVLVVGLGVSWQAAGVLHDSRTAQTTQLMDQRMALSCSRPWTPRSTATSTRFGWSPPRSAATSR